MLASTIDTRPAHLTMLLLMAIAATRLNAASAKGQDLPTPVSPGVATEEAHGRVPARIAESDTRCPTFSWSGVAQADGYQLAVFELPAGHPLDDERQEPVLVLHATLPADARSWTPAVDCLARGEHYAWSVAALGNDPLAWSPSLFFSVGPEPSWEEAQAAASVLQRYLEANDRSPSPTIEDPSGTASPRSLEPSVTPEADPARGDSEADNATSLLRRKLGDEDSTPGAGLAALAADRLVRLSSSASAPAISTASLTLSNQLHLASSSDIFKDGELLLWDDGSVGSNLALGRGALQSNVDGGVNTGIGWRALSDNTSGSRNTGVGTQALRRNTTGGFNTAVGTFALQMNTTGRDNVAVGESALYANNGHDNTTVGAASMSYNTQGNYNTAVGSGAVRYNTLGNNNSALGYLALLDNTEGSNNVAIGSASLRNNTTGDDNVAAGYLALRNNVSGTENTAIGTDTLGFNDTGSFNVALGAQALTIAKSDSNTAVGRAALQLTTSGASNVAVGRDALKKNKTGFSNTAVGRNALENMESGSSNIGIGLNAGSGIGNGSHNIAIANDGKLGDDKTLRIGSLQTRAFIAGIHGVATGSPGSTVLIDANGQLGTINSSARFKEDIADVGDRSSERLMRLRPVRFRYRPEVQPGERPVQFGLIAEEVARVFPELVIYDRQGRPQTVKYHLLAPLLLNELQRQARREAHRETELQQLRERLAALEDARAKSARK